MALRRLWVQAPSGPHFDKLSVNFMKIAILEPGAGGCLRDHLINEIYKLICRKVSPEKTVKNLIKLTTD
jgi:hypothetical protein